MTNAHTPEPWKGPCEPDSNFDGKRYSIKAADGKKIALLPLAPAMNANARRIVACVNELAGKPEGYVAALEAQRDELAAALRFEAEQIYAEYCALRPDPNAPAFERVQGFIGAIRAALATVSA